MIISIITATFNNVSTIETTINSVLSQIERNVEYIVVDGNSTDGTYEIVQKYSDLISKIIHEPDKGIYDALNKGITCATGDAIGFLHADDFFSDNRVLSDIIATFENNQCDAVYGDLQYVDSLETQKIFRHWKSGDFSYGKLKNGWMPPHPATFIKRDVYFKYGLFRTDLQIAADYESILRFFGKARISCAYLPRVLVKMRTGGASNKSVKNILKKMKEDYKAMKMNKIGGVRTLFMKNLRKVNQLFCRK
jgi:glycosyltransferase